MRELSDIELAAASNATWRLAPSFARPTSFLMWLPPTLPTWLPPSRGSVAFEESPRLSSGAAIVTMGSSHRGSAIESTGAISALIRPSVQTKWRADAEARRRARAPSAVTPRITDAFATASTTIGKDRKVMGLDSALAGRVDHAREALELGGRKLGRRFVEQG